jgi:hypothetical protein
MASASMRASSLTPSAAQVPSSQVLKRYLATRYNLTPEQYLQRWGLPTTYPMVAPAYAAKRSELARRFGLGRKPGAALPFPAPAAAPAAPEVS